MDHKNAMLWANRVVMGILKYVKAGSLPSVYKNGVDSWLYDLWPGELPWTWPEIRDVVACMLEHRRFGDIQVFFMQKYNFNLMEELQRGIKTWRDMYEGESDEPWKNPPTWIVVDRRSKKALGSASSLPDALRGMKAARKAGYDADVRKGERNPRKANKRGAQNGKRCYAVIDLGKPIFGGRVRYVVQCLPERPLQMPASTQILAKGMTRQGARALADHLERELRKGTNPRILRKRGVAAFFKGERRSNPTLAVMGLNPPAGEDIVATWATIEYRRPDDPDGKRIVRVHEFPDGFIATPLEDGGITLRHPQGLNLWTRR